jgi:hypothetical protein
MKTAMRQFFSRVAALFGRRRRDDELSDEIRTHLDLLAGEHVLRRGATSAALIRSRSGTAINARCRSSTRSHRTFDTRRARSARAPASSPPSSCRWRPVSA